MEGGRTAGACSLLIGGIPSVTPGPDSGDMDTEPRAEELPRGAIVLPEAALHPSQVEALDLIRGHRRVALVCRPALGQVDDFDHAGGRRGAVRQASWRVRSDSHIDVAAVDGDRGGAAVCARRRSIRPLARDPAAQWRPRRFLERRSQPKRPARPQVPPGPGRRGGARRRLSDRRFSGGDRADLIDYAGAIVEASTPNGVEPTNHFWQAAHLAELGFVVHHAPTSANPHLPPEEIGSCARRCGRRSRAKSSTPCSSASRACRSSRWRVCSRTASRSLTTGRSTRIGVAIDCAAGEGGIEHDGTAAIVYGMRHPRFGRDGGFDGGASGDFGLGHPELSRSGRAGAWLRHVNDLYRHWIARARPRLGLDGFWIEKPAMGLRLLELASEQHIAAQEIKTEWVEWSKDGRALAIEPHVTAGRVKFAKTAYDKRMEYKRRSATTTPWRRSLASGCSTRQASKRVDDLADAFMYAVLRCLGDGPSAAMG